MTWMLERLLGRLPVGWLQLRYRKGRLLSAIAGVAFACLLVFFQLGFLGALTTAVGLAYQKNKAEVIISGLGTRTLQDGANIPRQVVLDALSVPGVAAATPLFVGALKLEGVNSSDLTLTLFGTDPAALATFWDSDIAAGAEKLRQSDTVLLDRKSRFLDGALLNAIESSTPVVFEANRRQLALTGLFAIGAGFDADGYAFVSDQTFLRLFPDRSARAPNHVLVRLQRGADAKQVIALLKQKIEVPGGIVRTLSEARAAEQTFQTVERPIGVIFGFGAVMGIMVGLVIVYQVLSTEVSDHVREYATLKAVGYRNRYFTGLVLEQATILAIGGYVPGALLATLIYSALADTTGLPLEMTPDRATTVVVGALLAAIISGLFAARRVTTADPAELY